LASSNVEIHLALVDELFIYMETEYFVDWHLFVEGVDKGVECTGLAG